MPLRLWKKNKTQDRVRDSRSDSVGTSSTSHSSRVSGHTSGNEDNGLTMLGTQEWLALSKIRFEAAWAAHHAPSFDIFEFRQVKRLASGCLGPIVLLRHKDMGDPFVLKVLEKHFVYKHRQIRKAETESRILRAVNFPFLVNLEYQGQDSVNLYLVMEYLPGGDVWHLMERQKALGRRFGEADVRFYISQVILALEYLHNMDVVYRDLKPDNIFIDAKGYLKIGDFGCSKRIRKNGRATTQCGTKDYMAPEIVTGQLYNRAVDYWSLGVLLYEFVMGVTPFSGHNKMDTYEKIVTGRYPTPQHVSKELKDLIQKLLVVDWKRRLGNWKNGFADLKMHDWFVKSKFNWEEILRKRSKAPFVPHLQHAGDTRYFASPIPDFNNNLMPNSHHLFKQQETPHFVDYFDQYFGNF